MAFDLLARLKLKDRFSKRLKQATKTVRDMKEKSDRANLSIKRMGLAATRGFGRVAGGARRAVTSLQSIAAVAAAVYGSIKLLQATIGGAMMLEQQKISMEHFFGLNFDEATAKKKADEYLKWLRKNANKTPFETEEVISGGTRMLQVSGGDMGKAKQYLKLAEDMAALNPTKSLQDAYEALADLAVGETERMKEFGFKVSAKELKGLGDGKVEKGAAKLMQTKLKKYFEGGAAKLSESGAGLLSTITGGFKSGLTDAGYQALERLKPVLANIATFLTSGGAEQFFVKLSFWIEKSVTHAINLGKWVYENRGHIIRFFNHVSGAVKTLVGWFVNNKDELISFFKKAWQETEPLRNVLKDLTAKAGSFIGVLISNRDEILDFFGKVFSIIEKVYNYFKENWSSIKPWLIGIGIAAGSLYTSLKLLMIVGSVGKAFGVMKAILVAVRAGTLAATAAQWGFNAAMLANPITWIIAAIIALIAIIVLLVKNWDTVKEVTKKVWDAMINGIKSVWNWVVQLAGKIRERVVDEQAKAKAKLVSIWNGIAGFFSGLWETIKTGASEGWEAIKDVWNKVTGFFDELWEGVKTGAETIWNNITGAITGAFETIKNAAMKFIDPIVETIENLITKLNDIVGAAKTGAQAVGGAVKNGAKKSWDTVKEIGTLGLITTDTYNGHRFGRSNIPYDGYRAELHRGERVLTKQENDAYTKDRYQSIATGGDNTFNISINGVNDPETLADQLMGIMARKMGEIDY